MRKCPKCGETKPYTDFNKDKQQAHGLTVYCKACKFLLKKKPIKEIFDLPNEIWKDILGFDGIYLVSNFGRVKKMSNKFITSSNVNSETGDFILKYCIIKGYPKVSLIKNGVYKMFFIHRLVGLAFISNPENKPFINHIDGVKENFNLSNLEWCTASENMQHAIKTGLLIYKRNG